MVQIQLFSTQKYTQTSKWDIGEECWGAYLVIDGMVATITAHAYIMGISVLGLFFRSQIKDPNAARDILNTWIQKDSKKLIMAEKVTNKHTETYSTCK